MNAVHNKKAFTIVELIVVISIMSLLMSMLMPAMMRARAQAKTAICGSNLHQLYLGFTMYLDDNNGYVFPLVHPGRNSQGQYGKFNYYGFEPGYSSSLPEGQRVLDRNLAKLYPYIRQYDSVEICPSFPYNHPKYKPKYKTRWMTYGINSNLSPNMTIPGKEVVKLARKVRAPASTLLFADSAMINTWQSPASSSNPMFEEWHYIDAKDRPSVHFRHNVKSANIIFCDGHVSSAGPENPDIPSLIPSILIGRFGQEIKY